MSSGPAEEPKAKVKLSPFDEAKASVAKSRQDFNMHNKAYFTFTEKFEGPEIGKITDQIDTFIKGMKVAYNLYIENFTIMFKIEQQNLKAKLATLTAELDDLKAAYAAQTNAKQENDAANEEQIAHLGEQIAGLQEEIAELTANLNTVQAAYKLSDKAVRSNADRLAAATDLRTDDEGLTFSEGGGTRRRNRQRRGRKSRR